MRAAIGWVVGVLGAAAGGAFGQTVVADYQGDFNTSGTPAPGWSYLSSSASDLGNSAAYVPLVHTSNDGGDYEATANSAGNATTPGAYPAAAKTDVFPGLTGSGTYVVLAYTFTAQQIAQDGNQLLFHTYDFDIPAGTEGPINVAIYKSDTPVIPAGFYNFPAGTSFSDATYGPDYQFGTVVPGDTLYIALGATGTYSGQPLGVSYTLALVPEPTGAVLVAFAAIPLLRRRRRQPEPTATDE